MKSVEVKFLSEFLVEMMGLRLSRELRAQSFAALTTVQVVIHYRSYFESL